MVRDCKRDSLTGVEPPGAPVSRALALRAGNDSQNGCGSKKDRQKSNFFSTVRKGDEVVLAWLDPQKLPAAVNGLLGRTGHHAAYLQQAGAAERPILSVEDLTAMEFDSPNSGAFNQSSTSLKKS